jgi:hypothetical protein
MQEIWKDVKGFEGYYQVSNLGRVKSLDRVEYYQRKDSDKITRRSRKGKPLVSKIDRYGYEVVHLRKDGEVNIYPTVHRLVAEAFIDNPDNKPTVNHKDCDKKNNVVSNLEWNTISENTKHASDNGLLKPTVVSMKGDKNISFKMFPDVVEKMFKLLSQGISKKDVAKEIGVTVSTVERYIKNV